MEGENLTFQEERDIMEEKKTMKILILSTAFPRYNGDYIANFFLEIATKLTINNEVTVVAPHDIGIKRSELISDVQIERFQYMPIKHQTLAYRDGIKANIKKCKWTKYMLVPFMLSYLMKSIVKGRSKDIVIANFIPSALIGLALRLVYKTPVILTIHSNEKVTGLLGKINKWVLGKVDYVIFNSSYTQDSLKQYVKKYQTIPIGVETSRFKPKLRNYDGKRNLKLISVGRLIPIKGYKYLINAMSLVPSNVELEIIGWGSLEHDLKLQVKKLNLSNVKFTGAVLPKDIPKHLSKADLFVMSSVPCDGREEALGVVLIEALANGLPVLATDTGGVKDIVDVSVGNLVKPKDIQHMSHMINMFIKHPDLIEQKSHNAIAKAKSKFDWKIVIDKYQGVLSELNIK